MKSINKLKILNDPIYGFITIPSELIFDILEHPYFQRLRRITQMGLSSLVYPGANHTRFHHALGAMHLMTKVVSTLRNKNVNISEEEEEALYLAILLHDIGHGPFSHALEKSLVTQISHEEISLKIMLVLNKEFEGKLNLAIQFFKGEYHRLFFNQLITGQLDIDRADYLKRDSFYTGVAEGNINSDRLISMLNVVDNELVIEEKAIYSVEKFLLARRLMYWQVYLHKTSIVAESMIVNLFKRAKYLIKNKQHLNCSKSLMYFLKENNFKTEFNEDVLNNFIELDDYDIISALKEWRYCEDKILKDLSVRLINRKLLKIEFGEEKFNISDIDKILTQNNLDEEFKEYLVYIGEVSNYIYNSEFQNIKILLKNGEVKELSKFSDHLNTIETSRTKRKYYICYPKQNI